MIRHHAERLEIKYSGRMKIRTMLKAELAGMLLEHSTMIDVDELSRDGSGRSTDGVEEARSTSP
jgi:hypothetical protein